jgi:hypothetical protein
MHGTDESVTNGDARLESLAAELTSVVYPIALRHDSRESWADLELELWKTVVETVKKWERKCRESYQKSRNRRDMRDGPAHIARAGLQV